MSTLNANAAEFVMNADAATFVPSQTSASSSTWAHVVSTEDELRRAISELSREALLFLDLEGSDLSKGSFRNGTLQEAALPGLHGHVGLITIGTSGGKVHAIDIVELGPRAFHLGLRQLLQDPRIIKVGHDFRQDCDALWHQFQVWVQPLFDCQLCDVMIRRLQGMKTTYVQGSAKLFERHGIEAQTIPGYGLLTQEQKLVIHERFSQDRHLWTRRPLPEDMIIYAKADVLPLPRLYEELSRRIGELMNNQAAAQTLVLAGSAEYAGSFAVLETCRCRLCCAAQENAKFDGCIIFNRMWSNYPTLQPTLERLWRDEDNYPLPAPGPSRFYINEQDESVPLPEVAMIQK